VVEGTGFENRHVGNRIEGSNPSLSAVGRTKLFSEKLFWASRSEAHSGLATPRASRVCKERLEPKIVVDTTLLRSLSSEQVVDGLGEIIKAGLIKDASILKLLGKESVSKLLTSRSLQAIVRKAINVKKYYIAKDPQDIGVRQILNMGHTVGHAIELKYNISHGKAVILGMLAELKVGESLGLTPVSVRSRLIELLNSLEIDINSNYKPDWKLVLHDKKIKSGHIAFPVIMKEGEAKLVTLDLKRLRSEIR
jgi:3-dehydroquinate synthase